LKKSAAEILSMASMLKAPPPGLLASALTALGEGVFIAERKLGKDGLRIVFANDTLCKIFGYKSAEVIGRNHGFLHAESDDRSRLARWLRAARPSRPLSGEGYLLKKDGSTLYAAWTISPVICSEHAEVSHVVATYRDMTEKRGLQEILGRTQSLEAVGRLAGGVAHDFNNLISVINGYCEMLAVEVADQPQALHEVTEIHNAGRKAATLTRQLLAFGRRQPMELRMVNLNQIVRENEEILTRLLGGEGELELELQPKLGNVRVDPAQFQQVLLNLCLNARDALRDRGRITISTANRVLTRDRHRRSTDLQPGPYVAISVSDNGTGIDKETLKHLFEPFFTTKAKGKGSGLGLSLVHGVVQQSGGVIAVKSELLVGSTFEILLPLALGPLPKAPDKKVDSIPPFPTTKGHERVLVVEEGEVLRKMVAGILTADGYRVVDTAAARAGLDQANALGKPVQLLVANLVGEGEKLAKKLHKRFPALRVVNTCNLNAQHQLKWLAEEQQTALPKPFALSELLKTARRLLDA